MPPRPFSSMPGPRAYPLLGTVPHYLSGKYSRDKMHKMGLDKYNVRTNWRIVKGSEHVHVHVQEFGPIVRETVLPGTELVWLFDPDDIKTMYDIEGQTPQRRSHLALEHYRCNSKLHTFTRILYPY